MSITKFESTPTSNYFEGIYGDTYASITYENDEPSWITFGCEKEGEPQYVTILAEDFSKLINLLKHNL